MLNEKMCRRRSSILRRAFEAYDYFEIKTDFAVKMKEELESTLEKRSNDMRKEYESQIIPSQETLAWSIPELRPCSKNVNWDVLPHLWK
jgi:hypothetical protein